MRQPKYLQNVLVGASALTFAGAHFAPDRAQNGPVLTAAASFVSAPPPASPTRAGVRERGAGVPRKARAASPGAVRPLSRPRALGDAFRTYSPKKPAPPNEARKPYLYFVDYG